jgi:tRNA threonylcarbamoyladenosine dehydratase
VEDFVSAHNWPALLEQTGTDAPLNTVVGSAVDSAVDSVVGTSVDAVVDACDQVSAKLVLAQWAMAQAASGRRTALVCVGAAGGKRQPQRVEVADLVAVTHDPLLASLRQRLRQVGALARGPGPGGAASAKASGRAAAQEAGLRCVFSREPVQAPAASSCALPGEAGAVPTCAPGAPDPVAGVAPVMAAAAHDLNCHGYGSTVTVTAAFGMAAAQAAIDAILAVTPAP